MSRDRVHSVVVDDGRCPKPVSLSCRSSIKVQVRLKPLVVTTCRVVGSTRWSLATTTAAGTRSIRAAHVPSPVPSEPSEEMRALILELRHELTAAGLDAGPETIQWHLGERGFLAPATSSIRRRLVAARLVTPKPKKRPHSSLRSFVADQPNETYQGDFTHWQLSDGSEVINWLDDHSRFLLSMTAHPRASGPLVVETFVAATNDDGAPASTLTDNGVVYTARFEGRRNAFEYLLAALGVHQKNGRPAHPQTQGKIERFHQTLKK